MLKVLGICFSFLFLIMFFGAANGASNSKKTHSREIGVLILAHGVHNNHKHDNMQPALQTDPLWHKMVYGTIEPLKKMYEVKVAFGMAERETIQQAVKSLEKKGVKRIIAIPLFISTHSPIIPKLHAILSSNMANVPVTIGNCLDSHPLVGEILLERAKELSSIPKNETVIIVAHGPNEDNENSLWMKNMKLLGEQVKKDGDFQDVVPFTLFEDAPKEIRDKVTLKLRKLVEDSSKTSNVIIVPLLLSKGGVESGIPNRLSGLSYNWSGKTLLPHHKMTQWVIQEINRLMMN